VRFTRCVLSNQLCNTLVDRVLRLHIELDSVQIDALLLRQLTDRLDVGRVAPFRIAHRGVDRVAGAGQCFGTEAAETARSAGYENDFLAYDSISTEFVRHTVSIR
jgi:hypothetical protein